MKDGEVTLNITGKPEDIAKMLQAVQGKEQDGYPLILEQAINEMLTKANEKLVFVNQKLHQSLGELSDRSHE